MTVLREPFTDHSSETAHSLYDKLCVHLKEIMQLQGIEGLLQWDQEAMMPPKAAAARANQSSALAGAIHQKKIAPALGALLSELEHRHTLTDLSADLNPYELANIRLALKQWKEATVLTSEVVQAAAGLTARATGAWAQARKESNFSKFAPLLEEHIQLARHIAALKIRGGVCETARQINEKARASLNLQPGDECFKGHYQVLLDTYEPGFSDERLQSLFQDLKLHLVPLIAQIRAKGIQHDGAFLLGEWDVGKQTELCHQIARDQGFDTRIGRLDVSTHPFTGLIHAEDVRMTTRYTASKLREGIVCTVHESGHSLYEQGRNAEYVDLPVSMALSCGIHESQSLLWERMVALGKPFWTHTLPLVKAKFPEHESLKPVTVGQFYNVWNRVDPSFIRVEADEIAYGLHVILRYEIEKALIEGDIAVADVPGLWNAKMKEYLGVEVTEDRLGCLQDTHWAIGLIGYFPTYTLGSIYAVQIFAGAKEAIPGLDEHLAKGEFHVLKKWLNENVHKQGSLCESGDDLIFNLTGKHLDSSLYVQYLTDKYSEIYNL
ncbi:hypothetical protein BGZ74_009496 [Mortierella antarctica]|nr:hypothetical protein BGZ74_009496 [Mortierella antarctica]